MDKTIKTYIDTIWLDMDEILLHSFTSNEIVTGQCFCLKWYNLKLRYRNENIIYYPLTDFLIKSIDNVVEKIRENKEVFDVLEDWTKLYKNWELYFENKYYLTKELVERLWRAFYWIGRYSTKQFMEDIILLINE